MSAALPLILGLDGVNLVKSAYGTDSDQDQRT
jgi:hypothetical protein